MDTSIFHWEFEWETAVQSLFCIEMILKTISTERDDFQGTRQLKMRKKTIHEKVFFSQLVCAAKENVVAFSELHQSHTVPIS